MSTEKSSVALTSFISSLFHNFPKLLLTNLLFAVPSAVFFGIFWFINMITGLNSNFILFLTAIPLFPFYAGVVQVTSHMVRGEENVDVLHNFISGVKENFLRFLVHGIAFYLLSAVSYASIALYCSGTKTNSLFWVPLVITALISLLMLFVSYYLNIMTVTMNINMKNIYRNCMLFSFGELKNNFMATFALAVLGAVIFTIAVILNKLLLILIICGIITAFIVPSTVQFIITFYVYDSMVEILDDSKKNDDETEKNAVKQHIKKEEAEEISKLASDSTDEYIFYNGKMVKRSAVEESLNEKLDDDF